MSPSGKMHIFGLFFEMVLEVVAGKGLTHREILDLMRSRMGAGYAKEFDELRKKGFTLQQGKPVGQRVGTGSSPR